MPAEQFQAALNSSSFFDHEQGLFFTLSLLGFADFLLVSRAEILLAAVKADPQLKVKRSWFGGNAKACSSGL